jgi:two-component system sensor histidine kinase/response regulator
MSDDSPRSTSTETALAAKIEQLEAELASLKQQQQQVTRRDSRLEYVLEATDNGLWDWYIPSGNIYFNRSYLRMLGYEQDDLTGTVDTLRECFIHPDDVGNMFMEYQTAVENRRASVQLQFRMRHRSGETIWVHSTAKFFEPDAQGRATRCVGINTDVSNFIRGREDLLNAKAQADIANKTKSEFLARVSHEIRTPLNAIIGIGYLMHDTQLDEQQQSYLSSINSAADSLLQIINQLLDFSKIEAGKVILEYAHFDLEQLFEKISRLFEASALHRNVEIVYDIKADVPRFLRGDASRLNQILGHLINNAFQYANTDQVIVRVATAPGTSKQLMLEFTVEDKGSGMTPRQLARVKDQLVFNKNSSLSEKNLCGLSICHHLVNLMQGELAIESSPNKGCKVTFKVALEHSHLGAKTLRQQPRDLNNIRVLIVDDSTIARAVIASTARSIHLQVDEESEALNALERIRAAEQAGRPYHFVLLDYRMPDINGLQLTGLIKTDANLQQKPWTFLISAYHRDEISNNDSNAALVDEFLSKPVSESRLFDAISQTIAQDKALQRISPPLTIPPGADHLPDNLHILIAEDNLVNQQVLRGILKKKNIASLVATNGIEALELLKKSEQVFDAVLMDLEMPEMDGLEATRQIRAGVVRDSVTQIPIIAITAQAMRGDRERCLTAGMNGYLSKPVNPELLYATLADILCARSTINDPTPR